MKLVCNPDHVFHAKCIRSYIRKDKLRSTNVCPICSKDTPIETVKKYKTNARYEPPSLTPPTQSSQARSALTPNNSNLNGSIGKNNRFNLSMSIQNQPTTDRYQGSKLKMYGGNYRTVQGSVLQQNKRSIMSTTISDNMRQSVARSNFKYNTLSPDASIIGASDTVPTASNNLKPAMLFEPNNYNF